MMSLASSPPWIAATVLRKRSQTAALMPQFSPMLTEAGDVFAAQHECHLAGFAQRARVDPVDAAIFLPISWDGLHPPVKRGAASHFVDGVPLAIALDVFLSGAKCRELVAKRERDGHFI